MMEEGMYSMMGDRGTEMMEGVFMYSISHWGMFPVVYIGWLPICNG